MENNWWSSFFFILFAFLVVIGIVAGIYLDIYIIKADDVPTWAKLFWFFGK